MATELIMPELGTTTGDMQVIKILKSIGDYVKLGEPILEVQTDKANVEVESYAEGYLKQLTCKEGDMVQAGAIIAVLGEKDEVVVQTEAISKLNTEIVQEKEEDIKESRAIDISTGISTGISSERIFASPLAKRMAKDADIDIGTIRGTGPNGRIVKDDVLAAIKAKKTAAILFAPTASAYQPAASAATICFTCYSSTGSNFHRDVQDAQDNSSKACILFQGDTSLLPILKRKYGKRCGNEEEVGREVS
jgi:pyruvate dehydrogenase E2 component (dihydrolipoamide acetyltransferase)